MTPSCDEDVAKKKLFEPRSYQLELVDYITQRNGIIFLPTGSGKTYIAMLALKRFSNEMQKPITEGGKRAFFMCNTVELARQQSAEIKKTLNLTVGLYIGERDVDNWSRKTWETEIKENQVLVGTAQIFVDIVRQNYIKVTDLSIAILDECHHATGGHPMHQFLSFMLTADQNRLPRVVGLTGVLIKGNKLNNVPRDLKALEASFRGNIITVTNMEAYHNVMVYSTKPVERMITYADIAYKFDVEVIVNELINDCLSMVDAWNLGNIPQKLTKALCQIKEPNKKNFIKNLLKDFLYQMTDFGVYGGSIAIMSVIVEVEIRKRQSETLALRNLYRYIITKCEHIRHLLVKKLYEMVDDSETDTDSVDVIINFSSPKIRSLLTFVKTTFENQNPKEISCLIFVERRYSAKCVYFILDKYIKGTPEIADILRPDFMVGRNLIAPGIVSILDRKWNNDAITKFRNNECNLIVCSSVLEEGIDVQACNYVFVLDPLKTFNSYIQTKGRARQSGSLYAVFAPKTKADQMSSQISNYQSVHNVIKDFLIGRTLDRDDPLENDIAEQFVQPIETYVIPSGACLNAESALQVLSRYCQTLPTDVFSTCTPWYSKENVQDKVIVTVKLPLQSTLRESIVSEPLPTTKLAKMSAALRACIKLHQLGELNDKLLPVTKRECIDSVKDELFQNWQKYPEEENSKSVGMKNNRRVYERLCPEEFYMCFPVLGQACYAHEIVVTPDFEHNEYNEHLVTLMRSRSNYAILSCKPLPALAEMPLFMTQGQIRAKIISHPKIFVLTSNEQLDQLRMYHIMIFRDLLQCWKEKRFLVLDKRNKQNSYLMVPLRNGAIDWDLVRQFQRLSPIREYTEAERKKKQYKPEDYMGRIVHTWYSLNESERYVVTKVLTDSSPCSPFPSGNYNSYEDFMKQKYGQRIVQKQQFLIQVRCLTSRRNFFINAKNKMSKIVAKRVLDSIVLIPEMCHNFMYPGDMWLKALFLPSILHRVTFMLHAENVRVRINDFLGLTPKLATADPYQPKPLQIDASLKRVVDGDGNVIEEYEEEQKLLPALPTVSVTDNQFEMRSLMNSESGFWKDYMEPQNFQRDIKSLYPVEIDYYTRFVSGLTEAMSSFNLNSTDEYSNLQLKFAKPKAIQFTSPHDQTASIADVPPAEKRRIKILDRSFNLPSANFCSAEQIEFLAALTTAAANDVFDMERFEVLGDSFLKFSMSLFLMHKYPKWHEGFLTEVKSKLVSNRNLLYCMLELDIPERICVHSFKPNSEWLPPLCSVPSNILDVIKIEGPDAMHIAPGDMYSVELSEEEIINGKCSKAQLTRFINSCNQHRAANLMTIENDVLNFIYKQSIPDKVVADTLEAILGVCVKNYGIQQSFRILKFFGICRDIDDKSLTNLLDLRLGSPLLRTDVSAKEVDGFLINYKQLEENLGYQFRDRAYLLQAITHPSFPTNRITGCYQQLEFIGDAILDFLISSYIFERCEKMNPGQLTDLRSALVNNVTLGCICVRRRFHLFLLSENSVLSESIKRFAEFQESKDHQVTDQVRILMEEADCDANSMNMALNIDVPKTLGDIVEAIIAAVYLDCRDLMETWRVIYGLLEQEINQFMYHVPIEPVRQLYEYKGADAKFMDPVTDHEVVMVKCSFTCLNERHEVNGFGSNKTNAKRSAAKHALQILSRK